MIRLASALDHFPGAGLHDEAMGRQNNRIPRASLEFMQANVTIQSPPSAATPLARPSPPAYTALSGPLLDIAIDDWNELFRAVEARLTATVGTLVPVSFAATPDEISARVQRVVLECVAALELLQASLNHERSLRHQLKLDFFNAQTALAQALAERGARAPASHVPSGSSQTS